MINKSQKVSSLENIYNNLESGMPENKSIKDYALPNARQWLGGRYVALWVLPIYLFGKIAKFVASSAFIKPYSPIKNGPSYKSPETLYTSLKSEHQIHQSTSNECPLECPFLNLRHKHKKREFG